tara:strand:+ start:304 stop:693 length:390 start_codon:yes stop_codon:yes gene_type:complete
MIEGLITIISSIIIGVILFQSLIIAPTVTKVVNKKDSSKFLRLIWPKFFLIISCLSLINILLSFLLNLESWAILYLNLSSFFIMFFCYLLTPTINNFKDNSNEKIWSYLHFLTIILTIFTLIVNVIIIL